MQLIRKLTSETVRLEDGFLWSDEFDWQPIEQNHERAVNGALITQEGTKLAGRPISLVSPNSEQGWIKRADLSILKDWSAKQGEKFTLVFEYPHDKRQFTVIFNHAEKAIEASPVKGFPTVSDGDFYRATLRFLEV